MRSSLRTITAASTYAIKPAHRLTESPFERACVFRGVQKVLKNRFLSLMVLFVCMYFTGRRFACCSPLPSACNCEWIATAEQENFTGNSPCSCVCVRLRARVCKIQEELQPEQSLWALSLSLPRSLPSSLPPLLAAFQFPPLSSPLVFSSTTRPVDFFTLPLSLWATFAEQCCRDLPSATAKERESRRKKRKKEKLRQTNRLLWYWGGWERH